MAVGSARPGERVGALIVAAGASRRMEGLDKIAAPLLGRPLISYSLEALASHPLVNEVVLVLAPEKVEWGRGLVRDGGWERVQAVCAGGSRRQDSVARGLEQLSPCAWVLVHDGARPCLDGELILRGLEAARETGAAVLALPVADTLKRAGADGLVVETLPRDGLWAVQTPQVFRRELLEEAHLRVKETVTDDAAMVECLGHDVRLAQGSPANLKVTTVEDLALAEAILSLRQGRRG